MAVVPAVLSLALVALCLLTVFAASAQAAPVTYYLTSPSPAAAWPLGDGLQTVPLPGMEYAIPRNPASSDYGRAFLGTTDPAGTASAWRYDFAVARDVLLGIGVRSTAYRSPTTIAAGATGTFSIRNDGGTFRFELVDLDASGTATVLGTATVGATNGVSTAYNVTFSNPASVIASGHRIGVRVFAGSPAKYRHRLAYNGGTNDRSRFTVDESPAPGTVSGRVTNSSTGVPVGGAKVTLGASSATTDSGGTYTLSNVVPGTYTAQAEKSGFRTGSRPATVNGGSTATVDFALDDSAPPLTSLSTSPAAPDGRTPGGGSTGWFVTTPTVTLTVADAQRSSATARYDWGIDPPGALYTGTLTTAPSGTNTLYYRSVDSAGNAEAVNSVVFKVDTSIMPPAVVTPVGDRSSPTPVRSTIDFDSTATDAVSGVNHVSFWWFDRQGSSWNEVGSQVGDNQVAPVSGSIYHERWNTAVVPDGLYKLQSQVLDVAGNTAWSPAQYVLVDNTGPVARLTSPAAGARVGGSAQAITGTVDDANLAGWMLQMRARGTDTWSTLSSGTNTVTDGVLFTLDTTTYADGAYELRLVVTDTAGNSSSAQAAAVAIDNAGPAVVSATAANRDTVNVVFSEELAPSTVHAAYFTIPGLTVSKAYLQADKKTVALVTTDQTDGTGYTVQVNSAASAVTDPAGNSAATSSSAAFTGTGFDEAPPAAPAGPTATSGRDENEISWVAGLEPDLAGYNVYRSASSDGPFTKVNGPPVTSAAYADLSLPGRGVYWYRVTAVDSGFNESTPSAAVSANAVRMQASVGAAGGTLTSSTGEVSLVIPPSALSATTTIQVVEKVRPADTMSLAFGSPAYDFLPSGQVFAGDVRITMSYDSALPSTSTVRLLYADSGEWKPVEGGSAPDAAASRVTGLVRHFTEFAAASVDTTPPTVLSISPTDGATDVAVDALVTIEFSEAMDPGTLDAGTLQIRKASATGAPVVLDTVVFSADLKTAYLYPDRMLDISTDYHVWIDGSAVEDAAGNPLGADVTSKFTTAATGISPHGSYSTSSNLCRNCHEVHGAVGPTLLVETGEKQVCYACHDGTGSSYNVKTADDVTPFSWDFGEDVLGGTIKDDAPHTFGTYHPVPTGATTGTNVTMMCSNCHNPHGIEGAGPRSLVPKKLDPSFTGAYAPKTGNLFCWTCHDKDAATSAAFISAASWDASTGFDHKTHYSAGDTGHNKSTGSIVMLANPRVPSKENIACKGCHSEHGSTNDKLIAEQVNGGAVTFDASSAAGYNGTYNPFCARCHSANGIGGFYWLGSPTNESSGHGSSASPKQLAYPPNDGSGSLPIQVRLCKQCHEPHGAGDVNGAFPNLTRFFEQAVCYRCHATSGNPAGAKDLATAFGRDARATVVGSVNAHDLGLSSTSDRRHNLDAEYASTPSGSGNTNLTGTRRHVECADCHNTHASTGSTRTAPTNVVSGPLMGVWGVQPSNGGNWSEPSTWSWGETTKVYPAQYEYQICLKCHSAGAYGAVPPAVVNPVVAAFDTSVGADRGSVNYWANPGNLYTDQAKEFNPSNASYHAVWGDSKASGFGSYVAPWTSTSKMYCTDCHESASAGDPKGPHGSTGYWMLKGTWRTGTMGQKDNPLGNGSNADLCKLCHDFTFANTGFSTADGKNLHIEKHNGFNCTACHSAVPHGWQRDHLLVLRGDPAPYNDHGPGYGIPDSVTIAPSGAWTRDACHNGEGTGCH